jgi:hypothetical protein
MFGIFGPFSMVGLMILGYDELVNNKKNWFIYLLTLFYILNSI